MERTAKTKKLWTFRSKMPTNLRANWNGGSNPHLVMAIVLGFLQDKSRQGGVRGKVAGDIAGLQNANQERQSERGHKLLNEVQIRTRGGRMQKYASSGMFKR
jgi:hypothetical protein